MQRRHFIKSLGITLAGSGFASLAQASAPDNPLPRLQPLCVRKQLTVGYMFRELQLLDEVRAELAPDPYMPDGVRFYCGDHAFPTYGNESVIAPLIRQGKTVRGAITSLSKHEAYFHDGTDMGLGYAEFLVWAED